MRATYVVNNGQVSIHMRRLSSLLARHQRQPTSIHPLPPLAPWQHRQRNSRHVQCPLKVACVCTSVLPSFYTLFDFFPIGIAMILQPSCWRPNSPHPRPNLILMGGRRNPQGAQFRLVPFEGSLKLIPNPVRNLGGTPSCRCCHRRCHRRHRHHRHCQRDSCLDIVLTRWSTHHTGPC